MNEGGTSTPNPSPAIIKRPPLKFKAKQAMKSAHQMTPVKLDTACQIKHISCGMRHSAAVDSKSTWQPLPRSHNIIIGDGTVYMWGQGKFGQLGLGDACQDVKVPTPLSPTLFNNRKIIKIACGARHTLFLTGKTMISRELDWLCHRHKRGVYVRFEQLRTTGNRPKDGQAAYSYSNRVSQACDRYSMWMELQCRSHQR